MSNETVTVQVITTEEIVQVIPDTDTIVALLGEPSVEVIGTASIGPQGPPGPPGADGAGSFYVHTQDAPSALWTVTHNLAMFPNITVVDTDTRQVEADIVYVDENTATIEFAAPATGEAFLS